MQPHAKRSDVGEANQCTQLRSDILFNSFLARDLLIAEIERFDPKLEIDAATPPPMSWYTDPLFAYHEMKTIFKNNWLAAARSDQLEKPSDVAVFDIGDASYLITRDENGRLHAFYNNCPHHWTRLIKESGPQEAILKCSYHGWEFKRTGEPAHSPKAGSHTKQLAMLSDLNAPKTCQALLSLKPIQVTECLGLIFINCSENPRDLHTDLRQLSLDLQDTGISKLRFERREIFEIDCNWKVAADNYLDGGYHVPCAHPGLASQINMDGYKTALSDRYSVQTCPPAQREEGKRIGKEAIYAYIYPNLMINRYGDILDVNYLIPGPNNTTKVVIDWYFEPGRFKNPEEFKKYKEENITSSRSTQNEDVFLCENIQRGINTNAPLRGLYAKPEVGMLHFHQLVYKDMRFGLAPEISSRS